MPLNPGHESGTRDRLCPFYWPNCENSIPDHNDHECFSDADDPHTQHECWCGAMKTQEGTAC